MRLAADRDPVRERLLEAGDDEFVGLAEPGEWAGPRADVADPNLAFRAARWPDPQRAQAGDRAGRRPALEKPPSRHQKFTGFVGAFPDAMSAGRSGDAFSHTSSMARLGE